MAEVFKSKIAVGLMRLTLFISSREGDVCASYVGRKKAVIHFNCACHYPGWCGHIAHEHMCYVNYALQ